MVVCLWFSHRCASLSCLSSGDSRVIGVAECYQISAVPAIANRIDHSTSGVVETPLDVSSYKRGSTEAPLGSQLALPPYIYSSQRVFEEAGPEHTKGSIEVDQLLSNCLSTPNPPAGWNHPVIYAIIEPSPHLDLLHYANPLSPLSKRSRSR